MSSFESKQTRPFVGGWLHDSHSWMNIISYYSAINLFCWLTSITELRRNKCSIRTENKQVLYSLLFRCMRIRLYCFECLFENLYLSNLFHYFFVILMYYIQNRFCLFEDVVSTICHKRVFLRNFKMHFKCHLI